MKEGREGRGGKGGKKRERGGKFMLRCGLFT